MEKICVLGLGYIGLPTALLLAKNGFQVYGVDTNREVIRKLSQDKIHFQEPGLADLFEDAKANFIPSSNICSADVFIIAVPTPLI